MITGFNTDIEHDGVVYHVQTEDKGLDTPLILSLVYSGGAILASKRSRYEDLIASGFSDEALSERLTRQHKLICAAIHAGRLDDLKRMSGAPSATPTKEPAKEEILPDLEILRGNEEREALEEERLAFVAETARQALLAAEQQKEREALAAAEAELAAVVEEPAPVVSKPPPPPVLEEGQLYSLHESPAPSMMGNVSSSDDGLRITLLGVQEFRSGDKPVLKVMVGFRMGAQEQPIAKASVSVKVLGTTFRPLLYSAKTQNDGVAAIATQIPTFTSGRAAILIRAVSGGRETELRRIIHPGS